MYIYTLAPQSFVFTNWYYVWPVVFTITLAITRLASWRRRSVSETDIDGMMGFMGYSILATVAVFGVFFSSLILRDSLKEREHYYENKQVVGVLNEAFSRVEGTKSKHNVLYVDYIVEGRHIYLRVDSEYGYPERVIFYRNVKFER